VKLEFYSVNDVEQRLFVFGEVPGGGSVVDSYEEFGVVNSCFDIFEYFIFVSIRFLSFVKEFRKDQVPVRESRGFGFVEVKENKIICEFEYGGEGWWGYTHEVMAKVLHFMHQCWRVPIGGIVGR
jgi:hypothetical protein